MDAIGFSATNGGLLGGGTVLCDASSEIYASQGQVGNSAGIVVGEAVTLAGLIVASDIHAREAGTISTSDDLKVLPTTKIDLSRISASSKHSFFFLSF